MVHYQNQNFEIIVVSHPNKIVGEIEAIDQLFQASLSCFHLRKKTWFKHDLIQFIENIEETYHAKIMLHSHPSLVFEYDLKGFHFNKNYPYQEKLAEQLKEAGKTISIASHSICDMGEYELEVDYQLVSPVFPSISKPAVTQTLDHKKLSDYLLLKPKSKFFALGGIDESNINKAKTLGFDGAATLGYLWNDFEKNVNQNELIERFNRLKISVKQAL